MKQSNKYLSATPGPWVIGEDGDVFNSNNTACIAKVCGAPEGIKESKANAHLIAAAPELLEACKQQQYAESLEDGKKRDIALEVARNMLAWAIAKAEGK